jgi:hypothetical protein
MILSSLQLLQKRLYFAITRFNLTAHRAGAEEESSGNEHQEPFFASHDTLRKLI